jgi:3-hydroxyisobutyrate dehydrogenase
MKIHFYINMDNNEIKTIGWIGTGVMGKSMCKHLLNAGYKLSVYNRTLSKTDELVQLGAVVQTPEEMAKNCDAVFLMLGYPHDVEKMLLDEKEGILKHIPKGRYLIDHTTSSPDLADKIFKAAKEKGVHSYDAPVSGGDIGAKNGKLVVMIGGEKEPLDPVLKVMQNYSAKMSLMGAAGAGQHTKMTNQTFIAGAIIGVCEGLLYAYKAGLDCNAVIDLLSEGAAGSFSLKVYGPRIMNRDFEPGFFVEHFFKDLGIALSESKRMGLELKGLTLAHSIYDSMNKDGFDKKGIQSLYLALEKANGVSDGKK